MISASRRTLRLSPASAKAPGKLILAGEHFVVLGAPAVAMAINLYSMVEVQPTDGSNVDIEVDIPLKLLTGSEDTSTTTRPSELLEPLRIATEATLGYVKRKRAGVDVNVVCEIPVGAGLGSSASTTVAIITAVARSQGIDLKRKEIFKIAFTPERFLHGSPSGVDQATCIYGGTIQFIRPSGVKEIRIDQSPTLLLCDSGIHHATKTLVGSVVKKSKKEKKIFREHLDQAQEISKGVQKSLENGDEHELGVLMSQNHGLLQKIGVSHPKLDRLVVAARHAGALGAKLTGAGGGGCIVAVCQSSKDRRHIAKRLMREGGTPYNVSQDSDGVQAITGVRALK